MYKLKLFSFIVVIFSLMFFLVNPVKAFELATDPNNSNLPESKSVNDNYFTFGNAITIDGNVNGDLVAAGNQISVNGNVDNNVFIGGNTIIIKGHIKRDVFIGGAYVTIDKDAVIDGDVSIGASNIVIDGEIKGLLRVGTADLTINGKVEKGINAGVSNLKINSGAEINGDINYTSDNEAVINGNSKITGSIERKQATTITKNNTLRDTFTSYLLTLLTSLLFGLVLISIAPIKSKDIINLIQNKFWKSLGLGVLILIVVPMVSLFLLMILIGIPLSLTLMALYIFLIYISQIIVGYALVDKINKGKWAPIWSMTLGVLIIMIIGMIPFLGGLVDFITVLLCLGSVSMNAFIKNK